MGDRVQELLAQLTAVEWIAGFIAFAVIITALATFTDALKKLHEIGRSAWAEFKGRKGPDAELQKQFDVLRRNVIYCGLTNNIPVELHKLRAFLIEKGIVEKPEVRRFFDRWLWTFAVVEGLAVVNAFTPAELGQLTEELRGLQL